MKYTIVTGASITSIGFLAAKRLAAPPFAKAVILACRDVAKGQESKAAIVEEFPNANVHFLCLDLASRASIQEFVVQHVRKLPDYQGIELLINNAGVGWGPSTPYKETPDGLEEIVGVNHFGHFYLTHLLLDDLMQHGGHARVINVSSSLHDPNARRREGDDDDEKLLLPDFPNEILPKEEGYDGARAYRISKLYNMWFTYELQRRLDSDYNQGEEKKILVHAISPGFIPTTGLTRRSGLLGYLFLTYILDPLRYLGVGITRSPDDGAEVIVQASTSDTPTVATKGGQYFHLPKGKEHIETLQSSTESYDKDKAKILWERSLEVCGL